MFPRSFVLPVLLAFALAYALLCGTLQAKWNVYCDHDIMVYLGEDRSVQAAEIPTLLLETEVGYPGQLTRYRPGYYLAWILEAYLWGDNPARWQFARVLLLTVYLATIIWWLSRSFGVIPATALTALLTILPGFPSVWIGLGPGEQYLSFFGAFFLLLLYLEMRDGYAHQNTRHRIRWAAILFTGFFLIGGKENMVVMVVPLIWTSVRLMQVQKRLLILPLLVTTLLILYTLFICWAVTSGVLQAQADFYGNSISLFDRVHMITSSATTFPMIVPTTVIGAYLLLGLCGRIVNRHIWRTLGAKLLILYLCLLLHVLFYNGWVSNSRYSFPGELLFFSFMVLLCRDLPALFSRPIRWQSRLPACIISLTAGTFVYLYGHSTLVASADMYTTRSFQYTETLGEITSLARTNPTMPIVFQSSNPYDFEAIFSVNRFLKSLGVSNPLFLINREMSDPSLRQPFALRLRHVLETMSQSGEDVPPGAAGTLPSRYGARFSPASHHDRSLPCMAIYFQQALDDQSCRHSFRVTY